MTENITTERQSSPPDLRTPAAILRPVNGDVRCRRTDVVCLAHGTELREHDVVISLAEAIEVADGGWLRCDYCDGVIVALGTPITAAVRAAADWKPLEVRS